MRFLLTCLLALPCSSMSAQSVAISNNGGAAHQSAQLDVSSDSKGILIPKVALASRNVAAPVQNPTNSLMVYNTATAGAGNTAVAPGFYFWNNGIWIPVGLNTGTEISGKNNLVAQDSVGRISAKKGYGALAINYIIALNGIYPCRSDCGGSDDYDIAMMGEIRLFAGNFAPRGWAFCNGQTLPINQNLSLFSLLWTTYGGDGRTTFALPDLRSAVPVHFGTSPAGQTWTLGEKKD